MIYNKEDMALSADIEAIDDLLSLEGLELDEALDKPINRLRFLFPNKRFPEKSLKDIIYRVVCCSIDVPEQMVLAEVVALWCTKTGRSKLELDILVNHIIDAEFRALVEIEAEVKYLSIVKKNVHALTEDAQLRSRLFTQTDYDDDGNYIFDNHKLDLDFTGWND